MRLAQRSRRRLMMATDLDTLMLRAEPTLPQLWMRKRRLAGPDQWVERLWLRVVSQTLVERAG
jgi:hypothetical protein